MVYFGMVMYAELVIASELGKMSEKNEKSTLRNREPNIEFLLTQLKDLDSIIEKSVDLIEKLENNKELQEMYLDEVKPFVDEYKSVSKELVQDFIEHFKWEKSINRPRSLRYRRIYSQLVSDIKVGKNGFC